MKSIGFLVRIDGEWRFTEVDPIHIPAARKRQIVASGEGVELI